MYNKQETLKLLQDRNQDVQEHVWIAEKNKLMAICTKILKSSFEAEHIVADIFTDFFYSYIDNIKKSSSIPAYLRIMAIRRSTKRNKEINRFLEFDNEIQGAPHTEAGEQRIDNKTFSMWLKECLTKLSERSARILKLHYGLEKSYSAIGEQLNISKQAIGKNVLKSRQMLKKCVEKHQKDQTVG